LLGRIEQAVQRLADANPGRDTGRPVPGTDPAAVSAPAGAAQGLDEFNPVGRWNIQVQDMVGSRLYAEFAPNGMFQMMQQVGLYQVPVGGSWSYNPLTRQLGLQGVVNTFQPFVLMMTLSGVLPNGYAAVGNDGIGYVLSRA
jgi:hypothetical protein